MLEQRFGQERFVGARNLHRHFDRGLQVGDDVGVLYARVAFARRSQGAEEVRAHEEDDAAAVQLVRREHATHVRLERAPVLGLDTAVAVVAEKEAARSEVLEAHERLARLALRLHEHREARVVLRKLDHLRLRRTEAVAAAAAIAALVAVVAEHAVGEGEIDGEGAEQRESAHGTGTMRIWCCVLPRGVIGDEQALADRIVGDATHLL